jgi:hypothetical protein
MKNILKVKRVIYGKDSTPIDLREYRLTEGSPVGTRKDWEQVALENGYDGVEFIEIRKCETCGKRFYGSDILCKKCRENDDMLRYISDGGEPF